MNPATVHRILDAAHAAELAAALPHAAAAPAAAMAMTFETAWTKPGRYFHVAWRCADELVSLCIVEAAAADRLARRLRRHEDTGAACAHCHAALAAPDVLVQRFPYDYRLPRLAECMDVAGLARLSAGAHLFECAEPVAYRPGMRCQIRYGIGGSQRAYGKISVEREPGRRALLHGRLHEALERAGTDLRVPAPLGSVRELGLDLAAAVAGTSIHELLAAGPDAEIVARAAEALGELHLVAPAPADRIHAPGDELALVQAWAAWMADVEPALAEPLFRVRARLAAQMPTDASEPVFAHRDFYDKQILVDGDRIWLLDVDTACTGDRELDLGNFVAHLFLRGLQLDRVAAHRALEETAVHAYAQRASVPARADRTRWYRRAALMRLACTYWLRPPWRHLCAPLLEEAMA